MSTPKWHEGRLVGVDTETTGTNVHEDRIVTAAIVHHTPGTRPRSLTWLLDPGIPVPEQASDVHGWTTDKIQTELDGAQAARYTGDRKMPMTRQQALWEIAGHVALPMSQGTPLVAANAAYDLSLLEAELVRHNVETLAARLAPDGVRGVVDPMILDKQHDPYRKVKGGCRCGCGATDKTLTGLCLHYGVFLGGAHDAGADALAAVRLVVKLAAAWPEIARWRLDTLHRNQVAWRAEQMDGLRAYFDRTGVEHDGCCGSWPVHGDCCRPVPVEQEALV